MTRKRKIILSFLVTFSVFIVLVLGTLLYLYYHPQITKSLTEKAVSAAIGSTLTVGRFVYSADPLQLRAQDVRLDPGAGQEGFFVTIPELTLDAEVEGPFGDRVLVIKTLKMDGISVRLFEAIKMGRPPRKEPGSSMLLHLLEKLGGFLFFRDIRFEGGEVNNGQIKAEIGNKMITLHEIKALVSPEHGLRISFRTDARSDDDHVVFTAPHALLVVDPVIGLAQPRIRAFLMVKDATIISPMVNLAGIDLETSGRYDGSSMAIYADPFVMKASRISITMDEGSSPAVGFLLGVKGSYLIREQRLELSSWRIDATNILEGRGTLTFDKKDGEKLAVNVDHCKVMPENMLPFFPSEVRNRLSNDLFEGAVEVSGRAARAIEDEGQKWEYAIETKLKDNLFSLTEQGTRFSGRLSGLIKAEGIFPVISLDLDLNVQKAAFKGGDFEISGVEANLSLRGTHPKYTVEDLTVRLPGTAISNWRHKPLIETIQILPGQAFFDIRKQTARVLEGKIVSPLLGSFKAFLTAEPGHLDLGLKGESPNLIQWPRELNLLPSTWELFGRAVFDLTLSLTKGRNVEFGSAFSVSELGFRDPGFVYTAEKVNLRTELKGTGDVEALRFKAKASLEATEGEVLLDRFYLDLKNNRFQTLLDGTLDVRQASVDISSLETEVKNLAAISLKGTLTKTDGTPYVRLSAKIPRTTVKPLFRQFLLEPYQSEKPLLKKLELGGEFSADLDLEVKKGERRIAGTCRWQRGLLSLEEKGVTLQGFDLALPFWYQSPDMMKTWEPIQGHLSVNALRFPFLPEQNLSLPLAAGPNLLAITSSTSLRSQGGDFVLGPVICTDWLGRKPRVRTSLTLQSVDLGAILSNFWHRPLEGRLRGSLNPVFVEGDVLKTVGGVRADIFDGKVVISDISASGLGSPTAEFKLNAKWEDLNLEEMTKDTAFGKIEGILDGEVRDLEFAYGQPQRFELFMETVKKGGVSQRVSVKAVDNIAQIGGGTSPFVGLAGAFVSLFKEFPYKKIGIRASLENDIFKINGTIKEDGREYLIKRSGVSGVDVINQNPDNRIRFKDMLKRIKRVTAKGGGPVIK